MKRILATSLFLFVAQSHAANKLPMFSQLKEPPYPRTNIHDLSSSLERPGWLSELMLIARLEDELHPALEKKIKVEPVEKKTAAIKPESIKQIKLSLMPLLAQADVKKPAPKKITPKPGKGIIKNDYIEKVTKKPKPQGVSQCTWRQQGSVAEGGLYFAAAAGKTRSTVDDWSRLTSGSGWPDDAYVSDSRSNNPAILMDFGYTWNRHQEWFPYYSLGLRLSYVPRMTIKGYIDQYSLPDFLNYTYHYDAKFYSLMLMNKWHIMRWQNWMPFVTAGLGVVNYGTDNYAENAEPGVTPRVSPGFTPFSGTNFTYSVGFGLDYVLTKNVVINFQYYHQGVGTISTGKGLNYSSFASNYDYVQLRDDVKSNNFMIGMTVYV